MADQLSRIGQLEAELKAAYAQLQVGRMTSLVLTGRCAAGPCRCHRADARARSGRDCRPAWTIDGCSPTSSDLDQILSGGVPMGSVVLMNGPAGQHEDLAHLPYPSQRCQQGIDRRACSSPWNRTATRSSGRWSGWACRGTDSLDDLMVVDLVDLRRSMEGQHGDWRSIIMRYIENIMKESPFKLLALDSLESFMAMSEHEFTRIEVQELFDWFRSLGLTTFVISETPMARLEREGHMELYVADGAIELVHERGRRLPCPEVAPVRQDEGGEHRSRYYCSDARRRLVHPERADDAEPPLNPPEE